MPDEKMKYPLLEFEYDKKLYEELLTLNPHPEFMDRVSIVTEDYEHDDFGSLPGDEKNALGHAAGVLWKIQKYGLSFSDEESKTIRTRKRSHTKKPDLLLFVNDLENDFYNYCACIKHGLGNKADLCALTEALLCYGCEDTVWEEVTEWHTAVSENKNFAKSTFLPNFDRLYIRQADRFLFLELNTEEALKFYGLAALSWKIDSAGKPAKDFNDSYFISFSRQYELYTRILKGAPYPYSVSSDSPTYFQRYNRIIDPEASAASRAKNLDAFLAAIKEVLDTPNPRRLHRNRLALLMFIVITRKRLLPELARLYDDPDRERWEVAIMENPACLRIPVTLFFLAMQRI